jgi:hypothetical protein
MPKRFAEPSYAKDTMRYALIDDKKVEAEPGLKGVKGVCPACLQTVFARTGEQRIDHWAHQSKKSCDSWWEKESEWHRAWKDKYPVDQQEAGITDAQSGERHIADIRTPHGLVIELQHSPIDPQERRSRERFYGKDMVWVVDGTRRKRDFFNFLEGYSRFTPVRSTDPAGFHLYLTRSPDKCFTAAWLDSAVPVIFDFLDGTSSTDPQDAKRNFLWCLLPGRVKNRAVVAAIPHEIFVDLTLKCPQFFADLAQEIVTANASNRTRGKR